MNNKPGFAYIGNKLPPQPAPAPLHLLSHNELLTIAQMMSTATRSPHLCVSKGQLLDTALKLMAETAVATGRLARMQAVCDAFRKQADAQPDTIDDGQDGVVTNEAKRTVLMMLDHMDRELRGVAA